MAITSNPGEVELVAARGVRSKVFERTGTTRRRLVTSVAPLHWHDGAQWQDVDATPQTADGKTFSTPSTPYTLSWDAETLTLNYQSKAGGSVRVSLVALGGVAFTKAVAAPVVSGNRVSVFAAPQLEIILALRPYGIEIFKKLHSALAPSSLTWEIVTDNSQNIKINADATRGRDNADRIGSRRAQAFVNRQRAVEITHTRSPDDLAKNPGKTTYTVTETLTGRTRFIDPATSARSFVSDIVYPVLIDVTVNETIGNNNDDGNAATTTPSWDAYSCYNYNGSNDRGAAWRFQTVNIPNAATINSATLTVNVQARSGTGSETIKGQATDDAAEWTPGSANSPMTMSATTASTSWTHPTTTGSKVITVTSIIQEIVNRAGWVANNDLRLGFTDVSTISGGDYVTFEDYDDAGSARGTLDVDYTAGGGGGLSIPVAMQHLLMQGVR